MTQPPLCGLTATAMTALVDAVRAGDIEAAQALLPADPIVKRAREICARHMGSPSRWLSGEMDPMPIMGAVTEALRMPAQLDADTVLRMARAAGYSAWGDSAYLSGGYDDRYHLVDLRDAIQAALVGA